MPSSFWAQRNHYSLSITHVHIHRGSSVKPAFMDEAVKENTWMQNCSMPSTQFSILICLEEKERGHLGVQSAFSSYPKVRFANCSDSMKTETGRLGRDGCYSFSFQQRTHKGSFCYCKNCFNSEKVGHSLMILAFFYLLIRKRTGWLLIISACSQNSEVSRSESNQNKTCENIRRRLKNGKCTTWKFS